MPPPWSLNAGVRTIIVSDLKGQLVGILYREDAERALEAAPGPPGR